MRFKQIHNHTKEHSNSLCTIWVKGVGNSFHLLNYLKQGSTLHPSHNSDFWATQSKEDQRFWLILLHYNCVTELETQIKSADRLQRAGVLQIVGPCSNFFHHFEVLRITAVLAEMETLHTDGDCFGYYKAWASSSECEVRSPIEGPIMRQVEA